jgi:hypothetical protein
VATKPFVSRAQQRYAFATDQPWAEGWADETGDFSKLPERVGRRKAEPDLTRRERLLLRRVARGDSPPRMGRLMALGLVAEDGGGFRLTEAGRQAFKANWDARAGQTIAGNLVRGADGKFASGSGGSSSSPSDGGGDDTRAARRRRQDEEDARRAQEDEEEDRLRAEEDARVDATQNRRERQRLREANARARRERRRARNAARRERQAAERARRDEEAARREAGRAARRGQKPKKGGGGGRRNEAEDRRAQARQRRRRDALARIDRAVAGVGQKAMPASLAVFKTARGLRWVAFSSNGYGPDRDGEIVSTKALAEDVAVRGGLGPLRWWHLGDPDPLDLEAPWGPGVDLGWCDFAAMSGPVLVESGTFVSDAVGEAIARKAPTLGVSIGFFHPRDEPDGSGVFHHIRRFERSLAPKGSVANPLTGFVVPTQEERSMKQAQLAQLAEALGGVPEAEVQALISKYVGNTAKAAADMGLRLKTAEAQPVYRLPDGTPAIIVSGQLVALKAIAPTGDPAQLPDGKAEGDMGGGADVEAEGDMGGGADVEAEGGDYAGDLPVEAFRTMLVEAVAEAMKPILGQLKMADKMLKMMGEEMKGYMAGMKAQPPSAPAPTPDPEVAALKAEVAALKAQLTSLTGEQPRAVAGSTSASNTTALQPTDAFTVKTPGQGAPAYQTPADMIAAWVRGEVTAEGAPAAD